MIERLAESQRQKSRATPTCGSKCRRSAHVVRAVRMFRCLLCTTTLNAFKEEVGESTVAVPDTQNNATEQEQRTKGHSFLVEVASLCAGQLTVTCIHNMLSAFSSECKALSVFVLKRPALL